MQSATARTAATLLRYLPRERFTRALGRLTEAQVPKPVLGPVLRAYSRAYQVDLSEAEAPEGGYRSFNEFFTRKLREGLRPLDPDPNAVLSPADGRLDDAGPITSSRRFLVKGQSYDASELLGSSADGEAYAGGAFAIVYLSPRDYHRVHSPVGGTVTSARHVAGSLYPVNNFGVTNVPQLFARNERVAVFLDAGAFGRVAVVLVGALVVGRIDLAFPAPPRPAINGHNHERAYGEGFATPSPILQRGDELGAFLLGSTVVLLLPPPSSGGRYVLEGGLGRPVRFGQAILRRS